MRCILSRLVAVLWSRRRRFPGQDYRVILPIHAERALTWSERFAGKEQKRRGTAADILPQVRIRHRAGKSMPGLRILPFQRFDQGRRCRFPGQAGEKARGRHSPRPAFLRRRSSLAAGCFSPDHGVQPAETARGRQGGGERGGCRSDACCSDRGSRGTRCNRCPGQRRNARSC